VDGADFLAWQSQLGLNANLAAAHAVPEPASIALLLTALAWTASSIHKPRRR
jgi:hypothetical protein